MIRYKSHRSIIAFYAAAICVAQLAGSAAHASSDSHDLRLTASVYACVVNGQRVFSDQPCAKDAQQREIAESNRMNAQDTRILNRHESAPQRRVATDDDVDKKKAACNKLRTQQTEIQSRMRAGYTAQQGERLRERQSKLSSRYSAQRCERYR